VPYVTDIHEYFKRAETMRPHFNYLDTLLTAGGSSSSNFVEGIQTKNGVTEKMRYILVDWIVEVHSKFRLQPETLFLTVELMDRYLQLRPCPKKSLQLVGVTAMMVAAKYEEIYPPPVSDFVYISANTYTAEQILSFELELLAALDFGLTIPTVFCFSKRALTVIAADPTDSLRVIPSLPSMVQFLCEASLLSYALLNTPLSKTAAACVYLARKYLRSAESPLTLWTKALIHYTGYPLAEIKAEVRTLNDIIASIASSTQKAKGCYLKYENAKHDRVSPVAVTEATTVQIEFPLLFPAV